MTTSKPKGQNMTNPNTTQGIIAIIVFVLLAVASVNCMRYLFRPIIELPTYCAIFR